MSTKFTVFDKSTGRVRFGGTAADIKAFENELDGVISGEAYESGYINNGVHVVMPAQPSPNHVFDWITKQWNDPRTLQDLKDAKWGDIKKARSAAEFSPFIWDGSSFDATPTAVQHISGAVQMALLAQLGGQPFSIDWTLADNTVRTLSGADMIAVGIALGQNSGAVYDKARLLRVQIEAAADAAALALIVW